MIFIKPAPSELPSFPPVGSQLLAYVVVALFGYMATSALVPNIKVCVCLCLCMHDGPQQCKLFGRESVIYSIRNEYLLFLSSEYPCTHQIMHALENRITCCFELFLLYVSNIHFGREYVARTWGNERRPRQRISCKKFWKEGRGQKRGHHGGMGTKQTKSRYRATE